MMEAMELKKEASLETGGLTPLMVQNHLMSQSSAASMLERRSESVMVNWRVSLV